MRNRVFLVYLLIIVLGIGCSVSNGKDANIALPTMMCGMCETNIKSAVADLDGVMKVTINLEKLAYLKLKQKLQVLVIRQTVPQQISQHTIIYLAAARLMAKNLLLNNVW